MSKEAEFPVPGGESDHDDDDCADVAARTRGGVETISTGMASEERWMEGGMTTPFDFGAVG